MVKGTTGDAHAQLASLASHLLLEEVDAASLEVLRAPGVPAIFDAMAPGAGQHLERNWTDAEFEAEAVEYCRLFVLRGGASPYASAWLEDEAARHLIAEAEASAAALGLAIQTRERIDHLGVLLALVAEAWRMSDENGEPARELIDALVRPWLPRFAARLGVVSESPLYQALPALVSAALPEATSATESSDVASSA